MPPAGNTPDPIDSGVFNEAITRCADLSVWTCLVPKDPLHPVADGGVAYRIEGVAHLRNQDESSGRLDFPARVQGGAREGSCDLGSHAQPRVAR